MTQLQDPISPRPITSASAGRLAEQQPPQSRNRSPRVCQVLHSLGVGGAELLAASIAAGLAEQFQFAFACLDDLGDLGRKMQRLGYRVHVIGRRPGVDWTCARRLRAFLAAERVDLVHAHQYTPFFYSCLARLGAGSLPVLFTEHGRHHPDRPSFKRRWFNRLGLRRGDRIVGVGHAVRRALIENEAISARRVEVIYNGINMTRFRTHAERRDAARARLRVRSDETAIVQVARLDYLKDHPTALRTMERIVTQLPNARLFLVGDGPERQKLEAEIVRRGLQSHVELVGLRDDVHELLPGGDIFLLTSISEGIPLTVIEAMAAGLPVVATNVGGLAEVVRDGESGILAPRGDDQALAAAVLALARDAQLRGAFGRCGQERAERIFSEHRMCASYANLYREMLAS